MDDLKKVRQAIHRLASLVDEVLEQNRYAGFEAKAAVLKCLEDGEWRSIREVQQALRKGGLNLTYGSVGAALRKQASYGRLERERRQTGFQGGGVVYRKQPKGKR